MKKNSKQRHTYRSLKVNDDHGKNRAHKNINKWKNWWNLNKFCTLVNSIVPG